MSSQSALKRKIKSKQTILIGELASLSGRSTHTLRYYEGLGLIPNVERDHEGRRLYSSHHLGWIDLLGKLKLSGMSVEQMKMYTTLAKKGDKTLVERKELLLNHKRKVEKQIQQLHECLKIVHSKVDFYERWISSGKRPFYSPTARRRRSERKKNSKLSGKRDS